MSTADMINHCPKHDRCERTTCADCVAAETDFLDALEDELGIGPS